MKPGLFWFMCGALSLFVMVMVVQMDFAGILFVSLIVGLFAFEIFWPDKPKNSSWPIDEENYHSHPWDNTP